MILRRKNKIGGKKGSINRKMESPNKGLLLQVMMCVVNGHMVE